MSASLFGRVAAFTHAAEGNPGKIKLTGPKKFPLTGIGLGRIPMGLVKAREWVSKNKKTRTNLKEWDKK